MHPDLIQHAREPHHPARHFLRALRVSAHSRNVIAVSPWSQTAPARPAAVATLAEEAAPGRHLSSFRPFLLHRLAIRLTSPSPMHDYSAMECPFDSLKTPAYY